MSANAEPSNENGGQHNGSASQNARDKIGRVTDKFKPGVRYTLLISIIFYLAMFIIGVVKRKDCPVENNIPLFLIATGAMSLFSKSISAVREKILPHFPVTLLESSLYTAELVFFILGSNWILRVYKPSFDERDLNRYCNKTVYMFGFVYLIIIYIVLITLILGFCCFLGCIFFVKKTEENEDRDPEAQHIQSESPGNRQEEAPTQPTTNN